MKQHARLLCIDDRGSFEKEEREDGLTVSNLHFEAEGSLFIVGQ